MAFVNDILVDVWDKVNHAFTVQVSNPTNTDSLATSAKQDEVKTAVTDAQSAIVTAITETEANEKKVTIEDVVVALKNILNTLTRPMWINPANGKMLVDTVSTVTTVTTVTTLTGITNIGSNDAQSFIINTMKTTWATNVRGRIT